MIEKPTEIVQGDTAGLNEVISTICNNAAGIQHTSILPTVQTVGEGKLVIYDNDAGTKRIYVVTGKKNLGYINLI